MSQKIRYIIHLSTSDIWRGAEQQIIYLYDGLQEKGYQQTILCRQKSPLEDYCVNHHLNYSSFYRESGLNWNLAKAILALEKKNQIDCVHIHDPHAQHAYILARLLGFKAPAILHRRVDFPTAGHFFSSLKYRFSGIQKIVCVSQRVKETFRHQQAIYNKCTVVYDCIDIPKFQKIGGRKILEKDYPLLKNKFLVADIAALVDHKDHQTFIHAAHYITKVLQIKNVHFLIIGKGEQADLLKKMVDQNYLEHDITFLGFRNDLPKLLNGLDAYIFCSKMEGFGSTLLEVMAAQVPVIATKMGGPAEILTHQKNALLANVGDYVTLSHHVDMLINQSELSKKLTTAAFNLVKQFSISNYISQMEDIYNQIN